MPNLVNGLGGPAGFGEGLLPVPRNDDQSSTAIDITSIFGPSGINFFGTQYTSLYVNNNGNLTFGAPTFQYNPQPIGANLAFPIIAALWTDIDTRHTPIAQQLSPGGTSTGTNLVYYDVDPTTHTFTATWNDVDFYPNQIGNPAAFQIQLIDVGGGNFDIAFIYENVQVDESDYVVTSRAGYSPGQGHPGGFEVDISGTAQMAQIDTLPGNTGAPGYYLFHVIGGQVFGDDGSGGPQGGGRPPPEPPRPVTFGLQGLAPHREGDIGPTPYLAIITRSGSDLSAGSSVHWEVQTQDPTDLVAGQTLSGQVDFAPGQTSATVEIDVQGDTVFEGDDWFQFIVNSATHGDMTWDPGVVGTAIIRNDDSPVAFSGPQMRPEGAAGASPFEFLVLRTGDLSASLTVTWNVELNTANAQDLAPGQPLTGTLTFASGATQGLITINVAGDALRELDETFTVRLVSAVSNGSTSVLDVATTGTILDDDVRQTLLVSSPSATVLPEGDAGQTAFNFNIMRVGDLTAAVQIPYAITVPSTGGLSVGEIQSPLNGLVSFAAGSAQATVTVLVSGDTTPEDNEGFVVTLGGGVDFNTLVINGVVLNDDKMVAGLASPAASAALPDAEVSSFMSHLMGGSLWADAGAI